MENINASIKFLTLFVFLVFIILDLLILLYFDRKKFQDKKKYSKGITALSMIIKVAFPILGIFNYSIFWYSTIFLYLYLWYIGLKITYTKDYDLIIETSLITLIISFCLSGLLLYQMDPLLILFSFVGLLFILVREFIYFINKRRTLNFRDQAIEALNQKKNKESLDFIRKGIDLAGKMIIFRIGFAESKLLKKMKQEEILIQKLINKNNKDIKNKEDVYTLNEIFELPSLSKQEIRNYLLVFFVVSSIIFAIIYFFYIFY